MYRTRLRKRLTSSVGNLVPTPNGVALNVTAIGEQVFTGDARVLYIGDSLSARERSASGQGWDTLKHGILRTWTPDAWVGTTLPLVDDDSGTFVETPQIFNVNHTNLAGTRQKWTPSVDVSYAPGGDVGIAPCEGMEWEGGNSVIREYYEGRIITGNFDWSDLELSSRLIYHAHADSIPTVNYNVKRDGSAYLANAAVDFTSGSGILFTENASNVPAGAADAVLRFRTVIGNGDQSGNYIRLLGAAFYRPSTEGLFFDSIAIGSTAIEQWAEPSGIETGRFTDAALEKYMLASLNSNVVFIQLGRNDITGTFDETAKDQYKLDLAKLIVRILGGFTANSVSDGKICVVGTFADQSANTIDEFQLLNDACREVVQTFIDAAFTNIGFISLFEKMGKQRIDASHLEDGTHLTEAGADYVAGLMQEILT